MGDLIEGTLGIVAVAAVVLVIGLAIRRFSSWRDVRGLPDAARRAELLGELRRMRAQGKDVHACLQWLRDQGLRAGTAQGLLINVEKEVPADVARPREASWKGWRFRHPGNWKVDPLDPGAWPGGAISIEGPGSGMVLLAPLVPPVDYAKVLVHQEEQLAAPERAPITTWGRLRGEGVRLLGAHARFRLPVELVVFRPDLEGEPFVVVCYHATEEAGLVLPGIELVRDSLERA